MIRMVIDTNVVVSANLVGTFVNGTIAGYKALPGATKRLSTRP